MGEEREPAEPRRRLWQAKSVLAAIAISVIGLAVWGYAVATRSTGTAGATDSRMVTGMTGEGQRQAAPASSRAVDAAGPIMSRFGLSFLGGFGLGYASRKFLRWTLLLAAVAGGGLYLAHRAGVINLSSSEIDRHVQEGVSLAKSQADNVKKFLMGYIPSGAVCAVGAFMGFRHG